MGLRTSTRSSALPVGAATAWSVLASGRAGRRWYVDAAPFVFRAGVDRLVGGRRPAEPPDRDVLCVGDRVGFWLVTRADGGVLDLVAQVRAPGTVRLRTSVDEVGTGCRLAQSVSFDPDGILGLAYLLADLPAREALLTLVHRRVCADVTG